MHLKQLAEKSRTKQMLNFQKRESQIALNNADPVIKNKYEKIIPIRPHGTLPLSPALGPDEKL